MEREREREETHNNSSTQITTTITVVTARTSETGRAPSGRSSGSARSWSTPTRPAERK